MNKKRILMGLGAFAFLGLTTVLTSCGGEKTYTVKFLDGQTELSSSTVTSGYNVEVPTAPTSDGKIFNGWYADEALTKPFDFGSIIEGDTNVYAAWVNEFTVTFKDGSKILSTTTVTSGYNVKVPANPTAKSGKTFAGWFADAALTKPFNFGSVITSATTVYAKWDSVYHNVNLYIDGNTLWKTVAIEEGETLTYDGTPTKAYSTFANKWYTDAACTNLYNTATAVEEEVNLYAGWNVKTEVVTYDFDYKTLESAAGGQGSSYKTTSIVTDGKFYVEGGVYFEENKNPNASDAVQNDVNNQQKAIWFTNESNGVLSFDFKGRSTALFSVYKIDKVSTNDVVPTFTDADKIFDYATSTEATIKSGAQGKISVNLDESATYVIKSSGSGAIYNLKYTDTVEKSAPDAISVVGARNEFLVGASFESTGLTCTLTYENGSKDVVLPAKTAGDQKTGYVLDYSDVDWNTEGTYTVKVKYTAIDEPITGVKQETPLETSYEINVYAVDSIKAYTFGLDSSRNTVHNQLVYAKDATLSTSSVYVQATGTIGDKTYTQILDSSAYTFDNPTTDSLGRKTVTITYSNDKYGNKTSSYDVEVVDKLFNENSTAAFVYVDASLNAAKKVKIGDSSTQGKYAEYVDDTTATYAFPSVTEALQYIEVCGVPAEAEKTIALYNGTYNEKVFIDIPNVTIGGIEYTVNNAVGSNSEAIITFNAMNGIKAPNGANYSTDGAASFTISKNATNCRVVNVTLMNYYNTHERYTESLKITKDTQATAVLVRGDMAIFDSVSFSGYHDTLYADQGRQAYIDCYIEGRTDYIFGSTATAGFEGCVIKTLGAGLTEKNGGYVIATKGQSGQTYGYGFHNCTFTADENTQAGCVSIARGWDKYMTIMINDCNIDNHFSKGTYGQTYYEKEFDATTFADALSTGVYTYDSTTKKYSKLATTAEFDATATYFIQLNDRYTKMNADPVASLLFEYNNKGEGAIQYSADAATKYASETFTLMNPEDAKDQATSAKYLDYNEFFKAENGTVKYTYNWNPAGTTATITVNGLTSENYDAAKYSLSLTNAYVDNYLVDSQISAIKSAIKKSLKEGYNLIGIYTDSTFKTEFTSETKLTADTTVYARIIKGTLEVKSLTEYDGDSDSTTTGWSLKKVVNDVETTVTAASTMYISTTPGTAVATATSEGLVASDAFGEDVYLKSPAITDSVKEISVSIYGGTTGSGNASKFILTAYDKDGGKVAEQEVYSTGGKKSGYFSIDVEKNPNGNDAMPLLVEEQIVLKSTTNDIAYYTVLNTDIKAGGTSKVGKTVAIASIKTTYDLITTAPKQIVEYSKKLDVTSVSSTAYTADTLINDIFYATTGVKQESNKVKSSDETYKKQVSLTSGKVQKSDNVYKNGIMFTVPEEATITVVAAEKSDKSVSLLVIDSEGKTVTPTDIKKNNTVVTAFDTLNKTDYDTYEFKLPKGTYLLGGSGGGAYIYDLIVKWNEEVEIVETVTTSTSNATLNFQDTSNLNTSVFDISGATITTPAQNSDKDYASNKVIGDIKVNVKKGAVVYVSAYYNQSATAVEYTITANGSTTEKLNTNSYVVAKEDQTITITGSGNNYFQDIYVIYPEDDAAAFSVDLAAANSTFTTDTTLQYSVYTFGGMLVDTVKGKVTARTGNAWGQFNATSKVLVVLQKGQTVSAKTYNGNATMKVSVLDGEATPVTNAGAQSVTTFTADKDYTVVVVEATADDYIEYVTVQ